MAIREDGVSAVTVGELLAEDLQIPHYQRPFRWKPAMALQLLDDIKDALDDPERNDVPYVLGAVILHQNGNQLDIVDGQQRLLTLRMILATYDSGDDFTVSAGGDSPVSRVWEALRRRSDSASTEERSALLRLIRERCQFVRVVTDDVDEAFRVFDSQNYRGKPLAPHDLLKAHHLREMRNESAAMKSAVVETWESVKDADLDRLFSTYLYRIMRWSRGESAPGFTNDDVGLFKGISPNAAPFPSARYHLAAQTALPMFRAWSASIGADDRDAGRSQFQLDAPILAGRSFFEMVTFQLSELRLLAREAFANDAGRFCIYDLEALANDKSLVERPSRSRYRYVSELYLAVLLYYTNKFGNADLNQARTQLFAWAYALRIELLRVQFRSVDNRARGTDSVWSAFGLLRDAASARAINELHTVPKPYQADHEIDLAAQFKGGQ